jgi:Carboxypeptidase regulatory-like domain
MKTFKRIHSFGIAGLLLAAAVAAYGQSASTGALTGTVVDSNKGMVRDAMIKVTNEATGEERAAETKDNGTFLVPLLLPGSYRVEIAKAGFKTAVKTGLRINVTETSRLDVELEPGGVDEKMTVTAEAEVLQTESATLGRVTGRTMVENLPLVTRNYLQIIDLSPGVASEVNDAGALGRGGQGDNIRTHGSFARDTNIQMNGVQINDLQSSGFFSGGPAVPNPDAIEEFKVQTGLYDASNGRNAGAVVDVVTKSGSNEFHGSVFEFFRNDALNANSFFRNKAGQPKGVLRQNQFGFSLGGPIKKDRVQFFGSYQGMRQKNGLDDSAASQVFLPAFTSDRSRAALGALFAGQCGFLHLAIFGSCAGAATVAPDGSNISSQALALLNLKGPDGELVIPNPQVVSPSFPFGGFSAFSIPAKFDEDQFVGNVDVQVSSKSQLAGRFFFANSEQEQPIPPSQLGTSIPGFPLLTDNNVRNLSVAHTYTFSNTLVNQAQFGFHRINVPTVQDEIFKFSDIGVTAPSNADPFPSIGVLGSLAVGGNGQGLTLSQDHFNFQDSLTYVRGRHTFRAGGGVTRTHLDLVDFHFFGGLLFGSWADFLLGLPGGPVAAGGTGLPFSNVFLSLDIPGILDRNWRVLDADAYLQDDIKLTPSFNLFLGVRYEHLGNLADKGGRNSGFDVRLADPNPPAGGTLAGFLVSKDFPGDVPSGVTQLDNNFGVLGKNENNVGPRIGFAWQLPQSALPFTHRMVLRGGYGMYFSRATGQPFLQLAAGPPFAALRFIQFPANGSISFASPFGPEASFPQFQPYSPTTASTLTFVDPDYRPPVTQQFSLNLQTDLGNNFLLEVGYVGTKGTHLILSHALNQAGVASASNPIRGQTMNTVGNIGLRVPIIGFTTVGLGDIDSTAFSRYDALEVSVTKRMSRGLQFLAAYTFSHGYSNGGTNTSAAGPGNVPGDQVNNRANYGRTDFNREHRFVLSYIYSLPSPTNRGRFLNTLLGGWAVSGVTTIQSGRPLTLTATNALNVFGITTDRVQLASGCSYDDLATSGSLQSRLDNYINGSCLARNAAGSLSWPVIGDDGIGTAFGSSGVGILTGPGQHNWDIAVHKRTPVKWFGEVGNIEFRTEFYNAFNHPQFGNPGTNASSGTFGVISTTSVNPRIIQFALKVNF